MNWLHYLLEANLYLAVAYGCYWLLFRKQTFYTANRIYLLASTVLCFLIPLIQVGARATVQPTVQTIQTTATVIYTSQTAMTPVAQAPFLTPFKAAQAIYWLVVVSMCVWLIIKLYSLLKLVYTSTQQQQPKLTLVYVDDKHTPYSFFNYLFIDKLGNLDEAMLRHEMVHIRQKHSWDIMFIEMLKIINWFNPVVYLLQNSLKALHEFEADRLAAGSQQGADAYVDFLIAQAYHSNGVPFAHQFSNKQLLKSRIMKLYQKRSGKLARLNYLAALPLCAGLLCASTMAFSKDYGWIKIGVGSTSASTEISKSDLADTTKKNNLLMVQYLKKSKKGAILDSVEVMENDGKKHVYTPVNITNEDIVRLKKDYGVWIQIMHFPRNPRKPVKSSTTAMIPPPPPPTELRVTRSKPVYKGTELPPPPPPTVKRFPLPKKPAKPVKAGTIMFPPPKVYDENGKEVTAINRVPQIHKTITSKQTDESKSAKLSPIEQLILHHPNAVLTYSFQDLGKAVSKTLRYPKAASDQDITGSVLTSFTVTEEKTIKDVTVKSGINDFLDKEALRAVSTFTGKVVAKPGIYTYRITFLLANKDGSRRPEDKSLTNLEKATAGESTQTIASTKI